VNNKPVCERRDDESFGAAEVLVHVREVDVGDLHHAPVVVFVEVKPRLLQPLEISRRFDMQAHLAQTHTQYDHHSLRLQYVTSAVDIHTITVRPIRPSSYDSVSKSGPVCVKKGPLSHVELDEQKSHR